MAINNKKTLVNFVKKEYLLFKKEKSIRHQKFLDEIETLFGSDNCFILEPDIIQAVNFKAKNDGVIRIMHSSSDNMIEVELSRKNSSLLGEICNYIELADDEWILVYPYEWELKGGFLVGMKKFFSLLNDASWVMDDDFTVFNKNLDSSLKISGDRIGDEISIYNIMSRGDKFFSIVDGLKKATTKKGTENI